MNELTSRLLGAGWTKDRHPPDVFWGDFKEFKYTWDALLKMNWKTPCGLHIDPRRAAVSDTSYNGVEYNPENGNPLTRCPHGRKDCEHIPEGLRGHYAHCPCRQTCDPYDYAQSAERIEAEWNRRRKEQYMQITGGQYCACVQDGNGFEGGLCKIQYDVETCIQVACRNSVCCILKCERNLSKVNIFYDIRRTWITRQGFLEETKTTLEKGLRVFSKPIARTDAEIWLRTKKAEYDPIQDKHIFQPKISPEDRKMEHFSEWHRRYPGYDWFEFRYEVENIRIEAKETRDLLQDLRDVAEGIEVRHKSDEERKEKQEKRERRAAYRAQKERKRQPSAAKPAQKEEQISLEGWT